MKAAPLSFQASYYDGVYPFTDEQLRAPNVVQATPQRPFDVMQQSMLIENATISGYEGYDYSNPYAFQNNLYTRDGTLPPSQLVAADTLADVTRNIRASMGMFDV